ncbi:MAG: OmpA family protein [Polyangiales bacterium]
MTSDTQRTPRAALLGAAALLGGALLPATAQAQTSAGWALDRYDPTPAGDVFFASEFPTYGGEGRSFALRGGLVFDYARNPLVARYDSGGQERVTRIVSDMAVLHAQFGVAFANRVGVHLSLPIGLYQDGERSIGGLAASSSAGAGDPRLGVRVRILGRSDQDAISLHAGGQLYFNAGIFGATRSNNLTDEGFRGRLNLTLAGRGGPLRWSFGAGFHLRQTSVEIAGTRVGNDLFANGAIGFVALDDRLTIGPELWFSTVLTNAFEERHVNVEGTLGAHYLIADTILVGAGIGPGFTYGAGTPTWRGLVHVAYAPSDREADAAPPPDTDNDGVLDPDDLCPTVPQGANPDPARRGCPLMDTDQDGVFDPDDQCVTEPQGASPDPNRRGCPRRDTDGDTVFDDEDQCVEVPMGPNPDPERRGCPDGDDDRDGVLNHGDQCRTVPAGPQPDPSRPGCPIPDRDCDSVPDSVDACPDRPGAPSTNPQRNGCPGRVVIEGSVLRILEPVYFALNADRILSRSEPVLTAVTDALRAASYIRRVRIEGHTDDQASDEYNLDLSQRRANNVRAWLIAHGIEEGRLEARGFGESQPAVPIDGLTGPRLNAARAENRRVRFVVTDPDPNDPNGGGGNGPTPGTGDNTRPCPRTDAPAPAAH